VSLEHILQAILLLPDTLYRTFFLCAFSNILKRCSIWLSGSTKVQKDLGKLLVDPIDEFCRQCRDMLKRNTLYWNQLLVDEIEPSLLARKWSIQWHDARHLPMQYPTFDLLVTSPPYATCYEYKEIHQLTQLWFERYGLVDVQDENDYWIGSKSHFQATLTTSHS
jgi:adenine-specific DNA methylase